MSPELPPYRKGGGFGSLGVRFREVLEPPAVSLSPETPGAWITLIVVGLLVLGFVVWLFVRHARRRYRREAERELARLSAAWRADRGKLELLEAVPPLLKRCALQSFARPKVAPLTGERWLEFLSTTGAEPFSAPAGRALVAITTRGAAAAASDDVASLFVAARLWIRRHRAGV